MLSVEARIENQDKEMDDLIDKILKITYDYPVTLSKKELVGHGV